MKNNKMNLVRFLCGALALLLLVSTGVLALAGSPAGKTAAPVRIAALKGPTGIGLIRLMDQPDRYDVQLAGAPDEIVALIASGQADIAAVPTNLAAALYQKTKGGVKLLALNTLGVMYILEKGDSVHAVADLAGRELLATGQGAMPEIVLNYILAKNNVEGKVTIEYKAEHAELATLAASGAADLALLPEPFVTTVLMKNPEMRVALDLTEEFSKAQAQAGQADAVLSMGAVVVSAKFAQEQPEALAGFLRDYEQSVAFVNSDLAGAAKAVADQGLLPNEQVAQRAIPGCHIVFVAGEAMKRQVAPLYDVLFQANPASVGGAPVPDDFYWVR